MVYTSKGGSGLPSEVTFQSEGHGFINFVIDAVGRYEAKFYLTYGGATYESSTGVFTLEDVLKNLERLEIEASQVTNASKWGYVNFIITPQLAYKQMKDIAWKVYIADAQGQKLIEYGPKTKISYRFSSPGTYTVVVSAYRKADNSVYYTRELPVEVINQPQEATGVISNVTVNKRGQYFFTASVAYSDPDSKTVSISWEDLRLGLPKGQPESQLPHQRLRELRGDLVHPRRWVRVPGAL